MTRLLADRRVVITGGGRGIGLAAAQAMLDHGAHVLVADIDADSLSQAAIGLSKFGDRVRTAKLDVADAAMVRDVVTGLSDDWGVIDVLINNAAILDVGRTQDIDPGRWARVIDVNLTSVLRLCQAALPLLRKSASASIVNTTSTQSFRAQRNAVAYGSAKGGLLNLTRCMAVDLAEEGIRVNAVAPGFIDTRMALQADGGHEHAQPLFRDYYVGQGKIPLRRAGQPADCAGAFVFLASGLSTYITGQTITVDGGLSATY